MSSRQDIIEGTVYHYRYIDHGAQYRVYAIMTTDGIETGRVIKVPVSFKESKKVLAPHLVHLDLSPEEVDARIHTLMIRKQQLPGLVRGMFAADRRLMDSLGDLQLVPVLAASPQGSPDYFMPLFFTQEYVTPMAHFMHTYRFIKQRSHIVSIDDARRAKQLVRAIINLHYKLWEYGIFDTTFKIENVGVVRGRRDVARAILVDSAEHIYDQSEAEKILAKRKWRYATNPAKTDHLFLPIILHEEYMDTFNRALTVDELRKRWQRKSRAIEKRKSLILSMRQIITRSDKKSLALWLERQSLRSDLHKGIPSNRIDATSIPYADLMVLQSDARAGRMPLSDYSRQEKAERASYAADDRVVYELYRHVLQAPTDNSQ